MENDGKMAEEPQKLRNRPEIFSDVPHEILWKNGLEHLQDLSFVLAF